MSKNTVNWCVISPKALDNLLQQALDKGVSRTKSEFIRQAVLDRLKTLGFFWVMKNYDS